MIRKRSDAVATAEYILASVGADVTGLEDLLDQIIRRKLWENRKAEDGTDLSTFALLAIAPRPRGLEVTSPRKMRIVRRILLDLGFISELAELIEVIMRHRGRPLKNGANSANSRRFWTVPRSTTSTDRILITLKRDHPQEFEQLCAGKYSVAEAAKCVGLIGRVYGKGRWGVNDIAAAVKLGPKAQADLLCELFRALPVDAQCALLSRVIEQKLGPNLARRWREGDQQHGTSN